MLADHIAKSRADAASQGLKQMIVVERHLCERELRDIAKRNVDTLLRYRVPGTLEAFNLRAVETSKTMVAWEADDFDGETVQAGLFEYHGPAPIRFVTDFTGEVVQISAPIFYRKGH